MRTLTAIFLLAILAGCVTLTRPTPEIQGEIHYLEFREAAKAAFPDAQLSTYFYHEPTEYLATISERDWRRIAEYGIYGKQPPPARLSRCIYYTSQYIELAMEASERAGHGEAIAVGSIVTYQRYDFGNVLGHGPKEQPRQMPRFPEGWHKLNIGVSGEVGQRKLHVIEPQEGSMAVVAKEDRGRWVQVTGEYPNQEYVERVSTQRPSVWAREEMGE